MQEAPANLARALGLATAAAVAKMIQIKADRSVRAKNVMFRSAPMRGRLSIVERPELMFGLLTLALHFWVNGSYGYFQG